MLFKLAMQNIRGNKGFFFAYALTIVVLFSIIYQLTNISTQLESLSYFNAAVMSDSGLHLSDVFLALKYFMFVVVIFFAAYISRFFVRRRSKEIALLKTLGMNRKAIWSMLTIENTAIVLLGLFLGLGLGILTSRIFSFIALNLMGFRATNIGFNFNVQSMLDIVTIMFFVYIAMILIPIKTIAKTNIVELLQRQVSGDQINKRPVVSFILFAIFAIYFLYYSFVKIIDPTKPMYAYIVYFIIACLVAATLYRGLILNFFYDYKKRNRGLSKPVKQLSFAHLGTSVAGLYKMMSFITIMAAVVTAVMTVTFGVMDVLMKEAYGEVNTPLVMVSNKQDRIKHYAKSLDENEIGNVTYDLLNTNDIKFRNPTDAELEKNNFAMYHVTAYNLVLIKASTFNKVAKERGFDFKTSKSISNIKKENCSIMQHYCDFKSTNNLNKIDYHKEVGQVLGYSDNDRANYLGIAYEENDKMNKWLDNFITPNILIVEDKIYNQVNQNNYDKFYSVTSKNIPTKQEYFKYNNFFEKEFVEDQKNILIVDRNILGALGNAVFVGLFQLVFLLMSLVTAISLMMSIFFRTLENMEKGINEYVIAKQIGLSRIQILISLTIEAFISQVLPFFIGSVASIFCLRQMIYLDLNGRDYFEVIMEPSNIIVLGGFAMLLIALVIILVYTVYTRIEQQKQIH